MGGAPSVPTYQIQQPSFAPQAAEISAGGQLTNDLLGLQQAGLQGNLQNRTAMLQSDIGNRSAMLLNAAQMTPFQYTPDIWGQSGAYNTAKDTAYLNAVNSQALQQAIDPTGAKIRQNTENIIGGLTDPKALQEAQQKQFAQNVLPGMYGTGLSNKSTIFGSGLFDKSTLAGIQLQQNLAQLGQPYQNLPQTGLNPTSTAMAPIQSRAQAASQGNSFLQGILGATGNLQSALESGTGGLQSGLEYGQNALNTTASQGYGNLFNTVGQNVNNYLNQGVNLAQTNAQNALSAAQTNANTAAQEQAAMIEGASQIGASLLSKK